MSSEVIIIPKYFSGFKKELDITSLLQNHKGLVVITGDNGSGKTQILKYINNHLLKTNKKDSILFKITQFDNHPKKRIPRYIYDEEELNAQLFLKKIIIGRIPYILSLTDLENVLFDSHNYYYNTEIRTRVLSKILDYIKENFPEEESIKFISSIGYITDNDKKNAAIILYKKEHNVKKFTSKQQRLFNVWYKTYEDTDTYKKEIIEEAKKHLKAPTIKSLDDLVNYLNALFDPLNNNENILQKLPRIIEDDYLSTQKPEKNSILAKINDHIDEINFKLKTNKIKTFKYRLATPVTSIDYELAFIQENSQNSKIHFKDLSTGERALFELLFYAYSHSSKKEKVKYFLLDEFDANFNPTLIKSYIYLLNSLKDKIKIIITTHNPITVFNANYDEIYELDREQCSISKAKNKDDKKDILNKLAPDFVHDTELGFIGVLSKKTENTIILCEGKDDKFYLEKAMIELNKRYTIIDCGGADGVKNCITCLKTIPVFRNLVVSKKVLSLFDFDEKGHAALKRLANREFIDNNYKIKINIKDNEKNINESFFAMTLTPPNYKDYNISSKDKHWEIEHLFIHDDVNYKGKALTKDDKKNIKNDVTNGKYKDYTKFKELFNEIDEIENIAQ